MIRAWHFCADRDGKPVLRDGRPVVVGEWLTHDGPLVPCKSGLHASVRALDALKYAPGPWACFEATEALRLFARQCALDVAHLWQMPAVVREYLETCDETLLAAARAATRNAARAAAWDAARDAARSRQNANFESLLYQCLYDQGYTP